MPPSIALLSNVEPTTHFLQLKISFFKYKKFSKMQLYIRVYSFQFHKRYFEMMKANIPTKVNTQPPPELYYFRKTLREKEK